MCEAIKPLNGAGVLTCDTPGVGHEWHYDAADDVSWRDGRADD